MREKSFWVCLVEMTIYSFFDSLMREILDSAVSLSIISTIYFHLRQQSGILRFEPRCDSPKCCRRWKIPYLDGRKKSKENFLFCPWSFWAQLYFRSFWLLCFITIEETFSFFSVVFIKLCSNKLNVLIEI